MKLPEILRRLVSTFGLLVLLTLLGGTAGAVYSATKTPTYQAKAYVVVTADPGEPFAAVNFAQAYGRVVTRGPAAERAAATLGGTRELAQVTASTSPDAPVIEITATGTDAARTAVVANAVAQGLVDFAATRRTETRVTVSMLATASPPGSPSSPKPPLELAVGAAAGLLLAGLAALAGVGRPAVARRRDPAGGEPAGPGPARPGDGSAATVGAPALMNPSPTLASLAWYDDAFSPSEIAVLEGRIEDPAASEATAAVPRVMGRAVVIYQEER
jgi:capsular polysaccharide biosynthesis protein